MATALSTQNSKVPARPLKVLVPLIREELRKGDDASKEAGLPYYRRAGEMLVEAKSQLRHGEWTGWVKRNFTLTARTAQYYMSYANALGSFPKTKPAPFSNLSEFTHPDRDHHQPAWHEPIRETLNTVNVERLRQERQSQENEDRILRRLANELIDIGYKVLATKLHPDKGGSPEAMARLNKVRSILKAAI